MGNTKNIAFWIILFLLMVALFNVFSNGSRTSMGREISYSDFLNRVEDGQVASVRLDGERVYVTATDGVSFQTIQPRGNDVIPDLREHDVEIQAAPQEQSGFDLGARAVAAVPAADRRLDLLHEPDAGRRPRRRHGLRQVEGEAPDREVGQGDLQRRRRHRRGQGGARGDRRVPARPAEVLAPRRQDPQGRAARRPAGHRQDAARPRHRRRGGGAVLLDLAARTSSRCSSASAPAGCATCSSRRRRTRPASSSSTRSTRSAATAAPATAAATTSASRR